MNIRIPLAVIAAASLAVWTCGCSLRGFDAYRQPAAADGAVTVWFLGTSSILFRDVDTAILSDGFVSRPNIAKVGVTQIAPNEQRIDDALNRLCLRSLDAIFANHSHYDHVMDAPVIAKRTGAMLLGSLSTKNAGLGLKLPEDRIRVVENEQTVEFGKFKLTFIRSQHGEPDRYPGTIDAPLVPPAPVEAWKTGGVWSVFVEHPRGTALVHASANYESGVLKDRRADVVYLGIGWLGDKPKAFLDAYWNELVRARHARRVVLVHWDNFFRGLDKPLKTLPGDNVRRTVKRLICRAEADKIDLVIPVAWQATDPFAELPQPVEGSLADCP